jgi:hypothetical protein
VDHYQSEVETLQDKRDRILHREKEMNLKLESYEVARRATRVYVEAKLGQR